MYAIAIKITSHSSWIMHEKVYDDPERCDNVIAGMKIAMKPYKIQRVFFDVEIQ